jgi:hypothetical protein
MKPPFTDIDSTLRALDALRSAPTKTTGAWTLSQVLHHVAQGVEYSLSGFPRMKPALFRWTVGRAAFGVFDRRGFMKHPLDAEIPGAPALPRDGDVTEAITRLTSALRALAAHDGALHPHFAYGALDKPAFTRAHLMHLADHWREIAS